RPDAEEVADPVLQHAGLQVAGVDAVAERGDAREEAALVLDRLGKRKVGAEQRMLATRFGEAAQQGRGARLEVEHAAVDPAALQRFDVRRQRRERGAAGVDADRGFLLAGYGEEIRDLEEQRRGEVVDAVIAGVLENVQRDALARPGEAANENELHQRSSSSSAFCSSRLWRATNSAIESMPRSLRIWLRTAASTSTARLRPAATGMMTLPTVTPRMSSESAASGRRSVGSRPTAWRSRCATRRSFIFRRTAVSPKMVRILRSPRPRTSRKSFSIGGQRPSR